MKKSFFSLFLFSLLISCTNSGSKINTDELIRKEVMESSVNYAKGKFRESNVTVAQDGIITVTDARINLVVPNPNPARYIIDPSKITIGLINEDDIDDAIINIISVTGQDNESPENLIFIKTDGKFALNRVIESNMKILGIKDRIITAEVSSRSLNTPLRDCHICKEVVKYKFQAGDLVKVD
jgi:hypothetical protein